MTEEDRQIETLAEILCLNQAIAVALRALAIMSGEPDRFLRAQLEAGLGGIAKAPLWGVTPEQHQRAVESASARFSELITTVGTNLPKKP